MMVAVRHSPIAMYPQTAALTAILDGVLRRPIESLDLRPIHRSRAGASPDCPRDFSVAAERDAMRPSR